MKVDGGLGGDLRAAGAAAAAQEAQGYDGLWTAETAHDPFFPLLLASQETKTVELATGIAVAFARNPMNLAQIAWDLQAASEGRFLLGLGSQIKPHITKRFSMPWSHPAARMREMILAIRAIWASWNDGTKLDFQGEFYTHTLMTPFFDPGPNPHGNAKIFLAGVGELMTEVAGEVCDGFLCHGFTTERYLREVTLPALERGAAKAGRSVSDVEISGPAFVVTGGTDEEMERSVQGTKQQIAFYGSTPAYKGRPRPPRVGRPPGRPQPDVEGGEVEGDGRAHHRRHPRDLRGGGGAREARRGHPRPLWRHRPAAQLLRPLRQRPRPLARRHGRPAQGVAAVVADVPTTRYAKTPDDVHIAYQAWGLGPPDILLCIGLWSHSADLAIA